MAIRFRCSACNQLLSISNRKAGEPVPCPTCGAEVVVPWPRAEDEGEEADFAIRKPETDLEEMDLTPMVDVTFLLLIFFMITASFSLTKSIEVPAPDPDEQGAQQTVTREDLEATSVVVRIDERNVIYVDDEPVGDPDQLMGLLLERRRTEHKSELLVEVDPRSIHEAFVAVYDAAIGAGMQKIRRARTGGSGTD